VLASQWLVFEGVGDSVLDLASFWRENRGSPVVPEAAKLKRVAQMFGAAIVERSATRVVYLPHHVRSTAVDQLADFLTKMRPDRVALEDVSRPAVPLLQSTALALAELWRVSKVYGETPQRRLVLPDLHDRQLVDWLVQWDNPHPFVGLDGVSYTKARFIMSPAGVFSIAGVGSGFNSHVRDYLELQRGRDTREWPASDGSRLGRELHTIGQRAIDAAGVVSEVLERDFQFGDVAMQFHYRRLAVHTEQRLGEKRVIIAAGHIKEPFRVAG
jgi:hypothetical protein